MTLSALFLLSLILTLMFAWLGQKQAVFAHFPGGLGIALSFAHASWSLNFSWTFVALPMLIMVSSHLFTLWPKFRQAHRLLQLGASFWVLVSIYPFTQISIDLKFIAYVILVALYIHRNSQVFMQKTPLPGMAVGALAIGFLICGYLAFEQDLGFSLIWAPLLLGTCLLGYLPFALKGVPLGIGTWAMLGFVAAVLVIKISSNLTDFLALNIAFFPVLMDPVLWRVFKKHRRDQSILILWVQHAKWDPFLVAGSIWTVQFLLSLAVLEFRTFGLRPMVVLVLLLLYLASWTRTRTNSRLNYKQVD